MSEYNISKNSDKGIGRLVLSKRNLYKIPINGKLVNARKCNLLSENSDDVLIQTNKEFSTKDIYIKFNKTTQQIEQILGTVSEPEDDLNIFHHLYTKDWMSNSKYNKLWEDMGFNPEHDVIQGYSSRLEYNRQVITVDPLGSVDLDDGFSFRSDEEYYYLDIHIADPISYFDFSNPIMIEIFKEFINRINTCYIPNTKGSNLPIHLLPENVVKYVSLLETTDEIKTRRAVSFLFIINKEINFLTYQVKYTELTNIVNKTYEQFDEEINTQHEQKQELVNLVNSMIRNLGLRYKEISLGEDISHKMIEIFMIWVNFYAGHNMQHNKINESMIVRAQEKKDLPDDLDKIPEYCLNFLNYSANYKIIKNDESLAHYSLGISNYCHVSSPMRRVIDMLNHLLMYETNNSLNLSEFIKANIDIELINEKIKLQKKISNAYELVKILKINRTFKAFVLDIIRKEDIIYGLLILSANIIIDGEEKLFKKMVNVEIPKTHDHIEKYSEFEVELHYNAVNFKTSKFPFYIRIL